MSTEITPTDEDVKSVEELLKILPEEGATAWLQTVAEVRRTAACLKQLNVEFEDGGSFLGIGKSRIRCEEATARVYGVAIHIGL